MTLPKGHLFIICQHFQRTSPVKLLGQVQLNLICSLQTKGERKFIFILGHRTKMVDMPIYGKTLLFFFSRTDSPMEG